MISEKARNFLTYKLVLDPLRVGVSHPCRSDDDIKNFLFLVISDWDISKVPDGFDGQWSGLAGVDPAGNRGAQVRLA